MGLGWRKGGIISLEIRFLQSNFFTTPLLTVFKKKGDFDLPGDVFELMS
jgi:hypothetical protein